MRAELKVQGGADLARQLRVLPTAMSQKVQLQALKRGAVPIRDMAATLAPRDEQAGAPHLADNILIVAPTSKKLDELGAFDMVAVWIGPAAKFFYGYFQEIGTAFHPAKPFMRPAFDSQHRRSISIVAAEAWAAIRKALGTGGGSPSTSGRGL